MARSIHLAADVPTILALLLALCIFLVLQGFLTRRKMHPGPPGIPLLGNALQLPLSMPWFQFTEWKEKYGAVYSLNLAGQPTLVLNSHKSVADLFDRRSSIYSGRPRLVMAGEILTGGIFMIFSAYNETWRKMRRATGEEFSFRTSQKYHAAQERETILALQDLCNDPKSWADCLKRSTATNILQAVYGWPRITQSNEHIVTRIHAHTARIAGAVVPGAFLVELIPVLKHLPSWLFKSKREGLEWHERETKMFEEFNAEVEEKKKLDNVDTCFVKGLVASEQRHGLSKKESAWLAGLMFSAGAETTYGTLLNFVIAMMLYPDVAKRAQDELDRVVGRDRVPTFADFDDLPYIQAVVRETLRWRPVGPLAVPRRAEQDDYYEGYFIPKGTTVIPNLWAINRDPAVFPDFDSFRPDRFLDKSGNIDPEAVPDTHGMGHVTFGFGRRICAGYHFANQVLFIHMATMLWAFEFKIPLDSKGHPLTPSADKCIDAGVVVLPAPFECDLQPRFPQVPRVVETLVPLVD